MKYADARELMVDGDCVVLTHNKFRSWYDLKVWLIRIFGATPYTHIAMIKIFGGRVWVVESVKPFVRICTLSSLLDEGGFWWYRINQPATDEETARVLADVNKRQYSEIRAAIGQFFRIKVGTSKFVSCAEWFMSMRAISGLQFNCKATPDSLVLALQEQGFEMHYVSKEA